MKKTNIFHNVKKALLAVLIAMLAVTIVTTASIGTGSEEDRVLDGASYISPNSVSDEVTVLEESSSTSSGSSNKDATGFIGEVQTETYSCNAFVNEADTTGKSVEKKQSKASTAINEEKATEKATKSTMTNESVDEDKTTAAAKKNVPFGSNRDINPDEYKKAGNEFIKSLHGVHVCPKLNKSNSCWVLTVNTFGNQNSLDDIIECVQIEYDENVKSKTIEQSDTFGMYIDYETRAREDLGSDVYYYTFYIFYLPNCCSATIR